VSKGKTTELEKRQSLGVRDDEEELMNAPMQSRVDVKEAVRAAKTFVADILSAEKVTNIGLEEVRLDDDQWLVTVGFSRPWDYPNQRTSPLDPLRMLPHTAPMPDRD